MNLRCVYGDERVNNKFKACIYGKIRVNNEIEMCLWGCLSACERMVLAKFSPV